MTEFKMTEFKFNWRPESEFSREFAPFLSCENGHAWPFHSEIGESCPVCDSPISLNAGISDEEASEMFEGR